MSMLALFFVFLVFIFLGIPICFALGSTGLLYLYMTNPDFISMIPQRIWSGTDTYVMVALPLFIMAGELMNNGGITKRIIDFSLYLVRPIKGGLGEVTVVASMIFGGISGSSVADTSAVGSVLIPQMVNKGYGRGFATGLTVAASTMGMIIPPSVPMLMYAMLSGESVASLFLAGLIPGVLIGLSQLIVVNYFSRKRKIEESSIPFNLSDFISKTKDGILAIIMPLVIVISISFGIATASESAGIAVLYALILGFFVYKELKINHLITALKKTVIASSTVMLIIGYSMIFGWIMAMEQVPGAISAFFTDLNISRIWILLFLDLLILFIGTFVDVTPALLLLSPILLPVMKSIGVGPLQFGAIMIVGLAIGLVTPPLGMCLNAANKICRIPITEIFWSSLPFLVCNIIILVLVTFVPNISVWLPTLLMK